MMGCRDLMHHKEHLDSSRQKEETDSGNGASDLEGLIYTFITVVSEAVSHMRHLHSTSIQSCSPLLSS